MDWRLLAFAGALSIATGLVVQPRSGAAIGARLHRGRAAAARPRQCRRTEPRVPRRPGRAAGGGHARAARRRRPDAANARQPQRHRAGLRRGQPADDAGAAACRSMRTRSNGRRFTSASSPASARCQVCGGRHSARRFHFSPPATRDSSASRDVSPFLETSRTRCSGSVRPTICRRCGVTPVEGRLLDARDGADAPLAIVVNETLVRRFMPGQSALGRRIRFDPSEPWFTVVGVVKDVLERGYEQESKPGVYVAQAQGPRFFPTVNLIVRVDGDPLGLCVGRPADRSCGRSRPADPSDPNDDGGHRSHRWRSPSADDAAGRVRRAGARDRVARPVWAARANGVGAGPGDRDSHGARRHVAERDADGDVARHRADRRRRGHRRRPGVVGHARDGARCCMA